MSVPHFRSIERPPVARKRPALRSAACEARLAGFPVPGETVVRVARERGSTAVVVGERAHCRLGEVFLGSISRDVIRYAPCPVVVVRQGEHEGDQRKE